MNDPMQWDALRRRNYRAEARHAPSSIALNDLRLARTDRPPGDRSTDFDGSINNEIPATM